MKLALFFLLSVALHMTALLVPLSLNGRVTDRVIAVTVLPIEFTNKASDISAGGRGMSNKAAAKRLPNASPNKRTAHVTPTPTFVAQEKPPLEKLSMVTEEGEMLIPEVSRAGVTSRPGTNSVSGTGTGEDDAGREKIDARGGNGFGNGQGSGEGQASATLTQVRYRDTPQPQYPDSARRAGKEGRVLLRVLVDKEGRTKAIEVNTSSGHDLLDRAAAEAIKRWRFVPAHIGTKPIETWVKVPIEFQLSNAKP